jgi:hypothetical protein
MCSSENNVRYRLAALLGSTAFAVPEQAPWTLVATLLSVVVLVSSFTGRARIVALLVGRKPFYQRRWQLGFRFVRDGSTDCSTY